VTPFTAKSATEMLVMQLSAEPVPLRRHVPDVPEPIGQAIARALSKDREVRYNSVDYFVGALLGRYPAATAQGNASLDGAASEVAASDVAHSDLLDSRALADPQMPRATLARNHTPAPVSVGPLSSRFGLTPAPVVLSGPTVTTLSRATGEASGDLLAGEVDLLPMRPRRWPLVALAFVLLAGAAAVWMLYVRPHAQPRSVVTSVVPSAVPTVQPAALPASAAASSKPPQPQAMVRVLVRSEPSGATVVDAKQGMVVGNTPLERTYPQGEETLALIVRLEGHKDRAITVSLDGNSSTSVDLERRAAPGQKAEGKPEPVRAHAGKPVPGKPAVGRKPTKATIDEEEQWRVH
jgi:hypothetical protein